MCASPARLGPPAHSCASPVSPYLLPSPRLCASSDGRSLLAQDTACWHTALGNSSGNDRQNVIMGYNTVTPLRNTGGLLSPESLSALDKLGRLEGDARRRLLGV